MVEQVIHRPSTRDTESIPDVYSLPGCFPKRERLRKLCGQVEVNLLLFRFPGIEKGQINPMAALQQKLQGLIVVLGLLQVGHEKENLQVGNLPWF